MVRCKDMIKAVKECPLCRSAHTRLYLHGIYDCDKTNVCECRDCDLLYLDPIMSQQEEAEYYLDYYKSQQARYNRETMIQEMQEKSLAYFLEYKNRYAPYIESAGEILEIGSGSGGLLRFIKNEFPQKIVTAVEKSEVNLNFLRISLPEYECIRNLDEVKACCFDLICGIAVFEHLRDPLSYLKLLKTKLTEKGRIILEMPNKMEPLIEIFNIKEFKVFNFQKQHYFTYSEKPLKILAQKTGLEIESFYYNQQYGLDNHISWLIHRQVRDFSQYTQLFTPATLKSYKNDLIHNKTTDVIGVVLKNA